MTDLAQLEVQKRELLARIDGWSPTRLSYRASPGAWSTAEIFDHLVKTGEGILALAKRGLEKPHRIGTRDCLGFLIIQRLFQSDRKVKVPASATQVLPDENPDLETILLR